MSTQTSSYGIIQQKIVLTPWMNVTEAAEYLRTSPAALRKACQRRQVPYIKSPLGKLMFNRSELDSWIKGGHS